MRSKGKRSPLDCLWRGLYVGRCPIEEEPVKQKIAYLFPGQGAQYPGMGKDFFHSFPIAKETFQEADEHLKENLSKIIFDGPDTLLTQTRYSQLGILVTSVALLRTLSQQLPTLRPAVCAGLSLGEYTALIAAAKLSFKETLSLVGERGRLMNEACEKIPGAMAVVLGLDPPEIEQALRAQPEIWVANYNCPGQIVISGTIKGIENATSLLKEKGAKRIVPLNVHGAFHSGLMQSAQNELSPLIRAASFQESKIDVVMNVPGGFVATSEEIRSNAMLQVTHSVRWQQGILAMEERGIEVYLEIGCGKTLTGMNRKIGVKALSLSLEKVADLEELSKR